VTVVLAHQDARRGPERGERHMATDNHEDRNQRIQRRAYELWMAAGTPEGKDEHFWLMAERDIDAEDRDRPQPQARP
jgi:hypothetical protein